MIVLAASIVQGSRLTEMIRRRIHKSSIHEQTPQRIAEHYEEKEDKFNASVKIENNFVETIMGFKHVMCHSQ